MLYEPDTSDNLSYLFNVSDWVREFCARRVNFLAGDERRFLAPNVVLEFGNRGLFGLCLPRRMGGQELPLSDAAWLIGEVGKIDLSLASMLIIHNFLAAPVIDKCAPKETRQAWLPLIASGRGISSFAISESQAGSDPRRIRATATKTGDGWVLSGEKTWVGLAAWSSVSVVFAHGRSSGGEALGIRGFIVDLASAGVSQGEEHLTLGLRGVIQNRLHFDQVLLPNSAHLEGPGLQIAKHSFDLGRLGLGAASVGAMQRCLEIACAYVTTRTISTGRMSRNPVIRAMVRRETDRLRTSQLFLRYVLAHAKSAPALPTQLLCICKIVLPEKLRDVADASLQLMGGRGYVEANHVARFYRDARIIRIFEGPTETLQAYLGQSVAHDSAELATLLIDELCAEDLWRRIEPDVQATRALRKRDRDRFLLSAHHLGRATAQLCFYAVIRHYSTDERLRDHAAACLDATLSDRFSSERSRDRSGLDDFMNELAAAHQPLNAHGMQQEMSHDEVFTARQPTNPCGQRAERILTDPRQRLRGVNGR